MTRIDAHDIPVSPGTYVLLLRNTDARSVAIGAIGEMATLPGYYLYVGSARGPGGLRARVQRHFRGDGTPHWHIDHLRKHAEPIGAWLCADGCHHEHEWAEALAEWPDLEHAMPGFGASDCDCPTHLFYSGTWPAFGAFQAQLEWLGYCASGLLNTTIADPSDCATTRERSPRAPGSRRSRPASGDLR